MSSSLIPSSGLALVKTSNVPALLEQIRPAWQSKSLINRVKALLNVDPSSACQRLFNAAIHDLREKITVAGLDIAAEAARQNNLPSVSKAEDIENYPPAKLIDLAYRIGLLSRPEWRRVHRCYEIRRDLEHEDDEYEAGIEDCVYIFTTAIEVILSRDPVHLLRVADIKDLIQQASAVVPSIDLLNDYEKAPQPRQEEICKFLVSIATDRAQSDIVQQNSYNFLIAIADITKQPVKLSLAAHIQERIGRNRLEARMARVSIAAGAFPYLKQSHREQFFTDILANLTAIGHHWSQYAKHGELLRNLAEFGGLKHCPVGVRGKVLHWLVSLYLGQRGGQTSYGNVRHVFYSNTGAPLAAEMIKDAKDIIASELRAMKTEKEIANLLESSHIARRFEYLMDLIEAVERI